MMKLPRLPWYYRKIKEIFLSLICVIITYSCHLRQNEKVDLRDFDFKTTDQAELFFKNVRQSEYRVVENKEAKINMFYYKRYDDLDSTRFNPVIIHHWLVDKAYLWFEIAMTEESVDIFIEKNQNTTVLSFGASSTLNHLEVNNAIFNALLDTANITYRDKPLFNNEKESTFFKVVVNDYYRLVGLK